MIKRRLLVVDSIDLHVLWYTSRLCDAGLGKKHRHWLCVKVQKQHQTSYAWDMQREMNTLQSNMLKAQIEVIVENAKIAYVSITIAQFVVLAGLWGSYSSPLLLGWFAAMQVTILYRYLICQRYTVAETTDRLLLSVRHRLIVAALLNGVLWGALAWLLPAEWDMNSFIILLPILGISAAAMNLASVLPVYLALIAPIIIQVVISLLFSTAAYPVVAALFIIFYIGVLGVAVANNKMIKQMNQLQFDLSSVNQQLIVQKQVADTANASKSHFLAAASHDLRQPLHAMALFLGVLSENIHDEKNTFILSRLRQSLTAMQDMFGALLDMSRFDAGAVEPKFEHVSTQHILHELSLKFEGTALEKGLTFRIHPCHYWLHTDTHLLQRVLDNFLSNAIRYTETGGILLGCRKRDGHVNIEVWDTGKGIAASNMTNIFDAYQQLNNPERDRNKGVGLGLSIVRQITDLLNMPMSAFSKEGRGSVFRVSVALGEVQQQAKNQSVSLTPSSLDATFEDLDIWLVDDDQDILDALQILLETWGCFSSVYTGFDDVKAAINKGRPAPKILISDFRLRQHENGLDVIQYVQHHYQSDIPALIISGDVSEQRLQSAKRNGLTVLHKPVCPELLKQTIYDLYQLRNTAA